MTKLIETSRRNFVKLAGASAATAGLAPRLFANQQSSASLVSPSDRIRIATIGHGIIGTIDTATALRVPGVELVAVADVYEGRLRGRRSFTRSK